MILKRNRYGLEVYSETLSQLQLQRIRIHVLDDLKDLGSIFMGPKMVCNAYFNTPILVLVKYTPMSSTDRD